MTEKIGTTDLWMGSLDLGDTQYDVRELQQCITQYVVESRQTVTGMWLPEQNELMLLHWPDTREGYLTQNVADCQLSLSGLARALHGTETDSHLLEADQISSMMGRKVGGYYEGRIAEIEELAEFDSQLYMTPAHMVSARARHDGFVESYGEPTVYLVGNESSEAAIHIIGDQLEQHHYGIQRGSGVTDFYETKWATE